MHHAKSCRGDKILAPQHVAWIQDDLNSCDMSRWQKYVPATCRMVCSQQGKCPGDMSPRFVASCVLTFIDSGIMKVHLHNLAVGIFYCPKKNCINLDVKWIPRALNEKANYLNKVLDYDDWKVKDIYFESIVSRWGLCTFDCIFANCENCKVSWSYSQFFNPGSFSWSGEFCWLVPPIPLTPRTIKYVCINQCREVISGT